jgi:ppGpp synthetase/RelA/SpoT-type nucleotidyltranferase
MTISDETIKRAVQRYNREYDRYLKLCARVAEICRTEVVEGNAIRAQVTSRAKSPKSLEARLRRLAATGKTLLPDVDAVFGQVRDLAAVRIATYEQRHEEQVVQSVCKRFSDSGGRTPAHDRKDKNRDVQTNFYRATHIEVFLTTADIVGTYSNVVDVPCEIQVCSMMAHVWNEIEHDLGYKPTAGTLSEGEQNLLVMLGQAVRVGDGTIASLFSETERRQKEQGGAFTDVFDFVARVRAWFPGVDFGRHAGALFDALQPIRLVTPDGIRKVLNVSTPMVEAARIRLEEFSRQLNASSEKRFTLDENSSDLLLVLLLPKIGKHLSASSSDASTESAARLRWFADRFQEHVTVEGP